MKKKVNASIVLKLTGLYCLVGFLWIRFSDMALLSLSSNRDIITQLQTYKGCFFIAISGIAFYILLKKLYSDLSAVRYEYEDLFSTIRDGVVFVRYDGNIINANKAFTQTFSPAEPNIIGTDYRSLMKVTWETGEEEALMKQLVSRGFTDVYTKIATLKDGKKIPFEVQSYRVMHNKEEILCSVIRDISHSQSMMNELIKTKNKAIESDRLKTAFLQNMSHEIRTPMNGIVGFSEMLKNADLSEQKRDTYIDTILKSCNQLLTIVNDILDISKIETGQTVISESKCNINQLIDSLHKEYSYEAKERNIDLIAVKMKQNEETTILADENKLRQIFKNILSNAFKFVPNGIVRFGYRITNSDVLFFVIDNGPGIPAVAQNKIFDRFQKGEVNFLKDYGGTGLGLAICKGNIELMKGDIWVESVEGKGAQFYFSIPYKEPLPKPDKILDIQSANILVVEDEEINFRYIQEVFKNQNISVERATNGFEAVEKVLNGAKYSMIFMDIRMPQMNGYQATKRIREVDADVPIIAQTAFVMNENKYEALKAGCNDYIGKPIKQAELLQMVEKYVSMHNNQSTTVLMGNTGSSTSSY